MTGKYKVHRFDIKMSKGEDHHRLEEFLNCLEGEVVAIIPNVVGGTWTTISVVPFLLIIEKLG